MKKRYLAVPLTILLLASPINHARERTAKASYLENIVKNFPSFIINKPKEIEEVSVTYKLTKPIQLKEAEVYAKKPRFEDIDKEKRKVYLSQEKLNHYLDSLYLEIKLPREISKNMVKKMVKYESTHNIYALSHKGARGPMQIMEDSWNGIEKNIPYEPGVYSPAKNIDVGLKILKNIYYSNKRNNPHWIDSDLINKRKYILASYNWGIGNLGKKADWDLNKIPYATKKYIKDVLGQ
jgi:soluble lytic murein transglycosylase-like protein